MLLGLLPLQGASVMLVNYVYIQAAATRRVLCTALRAQQADVTTTLPHVCLILSLHPSSDGPDLPLHAELLECSEVLVGLSGTVYS